MTVELKNKIVGGVVVSVILLVLQVATTSFSGRWIKGAKSNDYVEKKTYNIDRKTDKDLILKDAFEYSDECVEKYNNVHTKEHDVINLKIENVEEIQTIQIDNIEKSLKSITDWINKQ